MVFSKKGRAVVVLCTVLLWGLGVAAANAAVIGDLPDISALTPYAVFGNNLNLSNVTITGDAAVTRNGQIALMAPSTVNDLYFDTGVTVNSLAGTYNTVIAPVDLTTGQFQLNNASTIMSGFTPDHTYANWTSPLTIAGNGGLNVLNVTGSVNLNSQAVTLTGGPTDVFVINVFGGFDLNGSFGIQAGTGMDASRILVNIVGTGSKVTSKVGNIVDGTILIPYRQMEFHSVSGAIYGGELEIKLQSDATVDYNPFSPPVVPEPASMSLWALAGIALYFRRRSRRKA